MSAHATRLRPAYSLMKTTVAPLHPRRGRPRKFAGPSRPVTLTLPETVIESLTAVDADLGRAVVRLAQSSARALAHPPAELAVFGRRAVIVVNPTTTLKRRTGVDLIPLADGRALISFDQARTIAELELLLDDALEDVKLSPEDRRIFESVAEILRSARRSTDVSLLPRSIIVLEAARASRLGRRPALVAGTTRKPTRRRSTA
jgi:hypothetical protein